MSYEQAVQAIERARLAGVTRLALIPPEKRKEDNWLVDWFKKQHYNNLELIY